MKPGLYATPSLPNAVVAVGSDGSRYIVPAIPNGWAIRTAYAGHERGLKPIRPQLRRLMALTGNYGIPAQGSAK